jgi:hypothetical protein
LSCVARDGEERAAFAERAVRLRRAWNCSWPRVPADARPSVPSSTVEPSPPNLVRVDVQDAVTAQRRITASWHDSRIASAFDIYNALEIDICERIQ